MRLYVLIVDDNRLIANSLVQMISLLGHEARAVYGSMAAIQSITQRTPDVLLMDIHMQGLNGVELCRYIRREASLPHLVILAMSTDTQATMVSSIREAGADGFLPKPIEMDSLERVIQQIESSLAAGRAGS